MNLSSVNSLCTLMTFRVAQPPGPTGLSRPSLTLLIIGPLYRKPSCVTRLNSLHTVNSNISRPNITKVYGERRNITVLSASSTADEQEKQMYSKVSGPRVKMDYEVIIVGARVAGSALAALLGEQGHRVLLLDKAHFPSDTLSTHFFRAPALRVFERLGVLNEVKSVAPPMTVVWNYIDGHVISDPVEAPEEHLRYFLCERRITLDWILLQRVEREPNIEVHQGAQMKELIWSDGRVAAVRWAEQDGIKQARAGRGWRRRGLLHRRQSP